MGPIARAVTKLVNKELPDELWKVELDDKLEAAYRRNDFRQADFDYDRMRMCANAQESAWRTGDGYALAAMN